MWICPKCGVKLVSKNLSHSCGRATLGDWKARMGPRAAEFYERFERMIANCGEFSHAPAKTRISFLARVRFANITALSEKGMSCNFALPKPLTSRRLTKVDEIIPGWCIHYLRVTDPAELDDELQAWLRESYLMMGMQQRLATSRARR